MKSNTIALTRSQDSTSTYRWIDQFAKRILLSKFSEITHGRITLKEGHNEYVFGQNDSDFTAHATVIVHEASFYSDIIF
ncbi:MAG: hypothetical protein OQK44_04645, partial [Gammaproteobacteria bacterium]|nr:hypothetical protein [Gammaproteobacteria bacterium]